MPLGPNISRGLKTGEHVKNDLVFANTVGNALDPLICTATTTSHSLDEQDFP